MLLTKNTFNDIDVYLFRYLFLKTKASQVKELSRLVSKTGDGHCYLVIGLLAYFFESEKGEAFFLHALALFAIYLPIYWLLKHGFKRQRPCYVLRDLNSYITASDQFSMPSGHTSAAMLMAGIISFYYPEFGVISFTWASLIGMSRITLGVHYPTDVLAGAGLGLTVFYLGCL